MMPTNVDNVFPLSRTRARILRVNAAGEAGAIAIYKTQLLARHWLSPSVALFLAEALEHERGHYRRFRESMRERNVYECPGTFLWVFGGSLLGLISLLGGRHGIMACTAAIEETVHGHLDEQIVYLRSRDALLADVIAEIQVEEAEHMTAGAEGYDPECSAAKAFTGMIRGVTEALICIATFGDSVRMKQAL